LNVIKRIDGDSLVWPSLLAAAACFLAWPWKAGAGWTIVWLSALVAKALIEESICRKLLLEVIERRYGSLAAVFGSSLVFSLLHFNTFNLIHTFIFGMYFGFLYVAYRSLLLCVAIHSSVNINMSSLTAFGSLSPDVAGSLLLMDQSTTYSAFRMTLGALGGLCLYRCYLIFRMPLSKRHTPASK
jgi:membrane protease YdiL (CAAX protease family)